MSILKTRGMRAVLMIFALAIITRLLVLTYGCFQIPVTSDESITVLQARSIIEGNLDYFVFAQPYQFPVEAYLMAPISKLLPANALGARLQSFVIAFMCLLAMLLILRRMSSARQSWPAILLVLFPSAYLTMIQFGYPIPHYTSAFLFWWAAILIAVYVPAKISSRSLVLVSLSGVFCGLAFTNNMVSLAVVLPIAIVICCGMGLTRMLYHIPAFAVGSFVGLIPYLAGKWRYPEAQTAVAGTREIGEALSRIWSPTLSSTLPRTLGISPGLFPDSRQTLEYAEWLIIPFAIFFTLILLYGTALCVLRLYEMISQKKWPILTVNEIFIGTSWLGLLLFIFSTRADAYSYRYLSPVAWSFPFVVYYAYNGLPRRGRTVLGVLVILLACFNLLTTLKLTVAWCNPSYAVEAVAAPDIKPALTFLEEKGIKHCVASHWAAYRINFLSDQNVVCSQPHNERFLNWIVPYKDEVDISTNVAYVLTEDIRFLKPHIFERHMRTMRVTSKKQECDRFTVYYDFNCEYGDDEILLERSHVSVTTSNNNGDSARMLDGNMNSFWRTDRLQANDMQVELTLSEPRQVGRLLVYCGMSYNDRPRKFRIEVRSSSGWDSVEYDIMNTPDKFRFEKDHPIYGPPGVQTILLEPVKTDAIRIVIEEADSIWAWTINEVEIYLKDVPAAGGPAFGRKDDKNR